MRKGCDWTRETTISRQFLAIEPRFVRKGCDGTPWNRNFTSVFGDRTSFRAKGLRRDPLESQFYFSFWRSNLISCERVATGPLGIAILLQFLAIEPHFVRKGCDGTPWNRNFTSVFGDQTSFRAKGLRRDPLESQFYFSFWRSNLISCERVATGPLGIAILLQFLAIEPHFVRKGCDGTPWNRNFTSVFGDRTSFRAKGLRRDPLDIAILLQFLATEPHFVRKGCDGTPWNRNFTSVFGDRTSFRAKGLRRDPLESQFYFSFWRYGFLSQFEPRAMRISSLAGKWPCCEKLDSYAGAMLILSM